MKQTHWILLLAVAALAIRWVFIDHVIGVEDEGIILHGAQRILNGEILYKDFFAVHPPVGYAIAALWIKVFGASLLAARAMLAFTILVVTVLSFRLCFLATGHSALSGFIVLSWVVATQSSSTIVNHHWFTTAFSLIAILMLICPGSA